MTKPRPFDTFHVFDESHAWQRPPEADIERIRDVLGLFIGAPVAPGSAWTWVIEPDRIEVIDLRTHRPDGRPRRSGHRHRGTAAWARRHG